MTQENFEGRTAAEAAIRACESFGVARSQLKYDIVSDEGEALERRVVIRAEVHPDAIPGMDRAPSEAKPAATRSRSSRDSGGRDRADRGGRGRKERGRGRRGERDRGDRGRSNNSRRKRHTATATDDGIESLLNLELVPAERGALKPELTTTLSAKATKAKEVVAEIARLMGAKVTPYVVQDNEEEVHVDLRGEDEALVIGKKGEVLLSLQFIINRIVGRDSEDEQVIVLDAADYRERRRAALADLATRLAGRAMEEGKVVRLSPMSGHDRRVFHLTLEEVEGVATRSEGDGLYRNLLIIPAE
ncbi:MAG: KH domain-containing protein [Myxococcota bacterium]